MYILKRFYAFNNRKKAIKLKETQRIVFCICYRSNFNWKLVSEIHIYMHIDLLYVNN